MVVLCNLSKWPRVVSLEADLKALGYGSCRLRSLLTTVPIAAVECAIDCVRLRPFGVFVAWLVQSAGAMHYQLMN